MEIHTRYEGQTLWQGRDAEGRTGWAITDNLEDGRAVEPSFLPYTSKRAAIDDVKPKPRGKGRPVTSGLGGDGNKPIKLRFTPAQRDKIEARAGDQGGAAWIRGLVEAALASHSE